MKTIALISQKGGVGKTTLATCLAVAAQQAGKSTALFDLDPQASATFWLDTRPEDKKDDLAVKAVPPARLKSVLDVAIEKKCDFAFIDSPPFAKDIAFEAAEFADLILIPTKPAVFDIMAMTKTLNLVAHYNKPAVVVLSICPIKGRELKDAEKAIEQMGATVAPVIIHNRIAFSRAQQDGLTAIELEPHGRAAQEVKQLYRYVCKCLSV